jgi:hypothetical protein
MASRARRRSAGISSSAAGLATNAALIAADPEHPQQREHHGGLAGAVGADERG